jgi:hypothetical protein
MTAAQDQTILIDGYNVIKRHPEWAGLSLQRGRERLIGLVRHARWAALPRRVQVVFDGSGPEESLQELTGSLSVRFARPSADAYMLDAIRAAREPGRLLVVSDDGEIARAAKSHGIRCEPVAWLLKPAGAPPTDRRHADADKPSLSAADARRITEELAKRWRASS